MFSKTNKWIWALMAASGYCLYYTNMQRTLAGYFTNSHWIFLDNVAYVVFFGLVTGFVIGIIVDTAKKKVER